MHKLGGCNTLLESRTTLFRSYLCLLGTCIEMTHVLVAFAVNPKDFEDIGEKKKKAKEMNFNAQFEGITLQLAHKKSQVIYTKVSGIYMHQ